MRVSTFLWFLVSWCMVLSAALLVAPSKALAQTSPDCPSWASVNGWQASYTLAAVGKGAQGNGTVNVSYSSSAETHLTRQSPLSCPATILEWTGILGPPNTGSTSYKSVFPCPEGGGRTIKSSYLASGIGPGSSATLTVDLSNQSLTFVPMAVSANFGGAITACDGGLTALPFNIIALTPEGASALPSFNLPLKPQISLIQKWKFQALDVNSGLNLTWTLTFRLTPDCDLPENELTTWDGWLETNETIGQWEQTLGSGRGTSFAGLSVQEMDAGGGVDTCWFPGSAINRFTQLSGGKWEVNPDNTWGPDSVGWGVGPVAYYRETFVAPCRFTLHQQMQMTCYDGSVQNYGPVNTLVGIIGGVDTVTSIRAGHQATRRY